MAVKKSKELVRWKKLKGEDWSASLQKQPQFADRCDWSKLEIFDWKDLLKVQPQFVVYTPDNLFHYIFPDGTLLAAQPQFADKCDFSKIDKHDWIKILSAGTCLDD